MATMAPVFERPVDRAAEFRGKPGAVRFLELPPRRCVMIDGEGPPGPDAFVPRMPGLYTTAYKLRFGLKDRGVITKVGPLEGLWWTSDGVFDLDWLLEGARDTWRWTLLIALPDEASADEMDGALAAGRAKIDPGLAANLRVESRSCSTSGRTRRRRPPSNGSTRRSRKRGWNLTTGITSCTSGTPRPARRNGSRRSSANR
jgi:hypothetical protein